MFSTRVIASGWNYIFRPTKSTEAIYVEKKDIQTSTETESNTEITVEQTVRNSFGTSLPYIIRIATRYNDLDESVFMWANSVDEIDWCQTNCIKKFDIRMFNHLPEKDGDWRLSSNGSNSVFFAFEDHDEALIFGIKFKR